MLRFRPLLLLACLLVLFSTGCLRAMNLYSYDLDSLAFMSTDIVEGTLGKSYTQHNLELTGLTVTAVHKGGFKVGQVVTLTALDFYRVPKDEKPFMNTRALQQDDSGFFFLIRATKQFLWDIPDDATIYWTAPSGLKLVRGNVVYSFIQFDNPGPYVALTDPKFKEVNPPTPAAYRTQIRTSIRTADAFSARLTQPATKDDIPWILASLRARKNGGLHERDAIAEALCGRLAQLHEPKSLLDALPLAYSFYGFYALSNGLGTPEGWAALLAAIDDPQQPMADRKLFADVLHHVDIPPGDAGQYLTRIARLATAMRQHDELYFTLLCSLDYLFRTMQQTTDTARIADRKTALAELRTAYDAATTAHEKYQIELTTRDADQAAYDALHAPCGPVISEITPVDPTKYTKPKKRSLIFEYSIMIFNTAVDDPVLVLRNPDTGQTVSLPSGIAVHGNQSMGGCCAVALPADLPAGRYRAWLQFSAGGTVISSGHSLEATL